MWCPRSCRTLCSVTWSEVAAGLGVGRWQRTGGRGTGRGPRRCVLRPADVEVRILEVIKGSFSRVLRAEPSAQVNAPTASRFPTGSRTGMRRLRAAGTTRKTRFATGGEIFIQ